MADYYQLIARAVSGLGKNTDEAWRAALYARGRAALVIELCGITPALSEPEITRECLLFEEAIRKIEVNLTHRPLSAAAVPAPLQTASEHPQHEPLIPEQGGSPIIGQESSREACIPSSGTPNFGRLELPIERRDQWIPSCVLPSRTNAVESTTDISKGEGINSYTLDKLVTEFRHGSLWEFLDFEYESCRNDFGIERRFPEEVFYRAANNVFLGRESTPAIVAALKGKVYKIYFGFVHSTEERCREFLCDASDHFRAKYGLPSGTREVDSEQETVFWDRSFGNVTLETNLFWQRNAIIYTSCSVRPRKRAWFGRTP